MNDDEFERLYRAHYDDLLRFAVRRVDQVADAADVVAETWAIAWRRREGLPPAQECRLWLFGTARKVLANQRRGRSRQLNLAGRLREALVETHLDDAVSDTPVLLALRALSRSDQEVLALTAWEQLGPEEIAAVLGCSAVAARVRLHRARRRLRAALARLGIGPGDEPTAEGSASSTDSVPSAVSRANSLEPRSLTISKELT